jgi:wyosine [tRNA(Phe)-imidazoG37] synthetase (radical SAM superfamily)
VDLVPRKVCCFDCLYCQVGATTRLTTRRRRFADPDEVVAQVQARLRQGPAPEVITLAGSGEPTLYDGLEPLVAGLRRVTDLPLVLLTNGALLWQEPVARAALAFDRVFPSLDAADEPTFQRLNRPAPGLTLERVLGGLRAFCRDFSGECRLEVMLVRGVNDSPASLRALAALARDLAPDPGVDLNTAIRPPAHEAAPLDAGQMARALTFFEGIDARIVATPRTSAPRGGNTSPGRARRLVLDLLARRPCTTDDLVRSLGLDREQVTAVCQRATQAGEVLQEQRAGETYFRLVSRR